MFIDGEDVSATCIRFDDVGGYVLLSDGTKRFGAVVAVGPPPRTYSRKRTGDAYGSHIPILIGLAQIFDIRNVIEFGCGKYSTPTFLKAYPNLESLLSFDTNADWIEQVDTGDERASFVLLEDAPKQIIKDIDFTDCDLVFVDDSDTNRPDTIIEVIKYSQDNILVFHDFEYRKYKIAASNIENMFVFDAYDPFTGVSCNRDLIKLSKFILEHNYLSPTDIDAWVNVYANEFDDYEISCTRCQ